MIEARLFPVSSPLPLVVRVSFILNWFEHLFFTIPSCLQNYSTLKLPSKSGALLCFLKRHLSPMAAKAHGGEGLVNKVVTSSGNWYGSGTAHNYGFAAHPIE